MRRKRRDRDAEGAEEYGEGYPLPIPLDAMPPRIFDSVSVRSENRPCFVSPFFLAK